MAASSSNWLWNLASIGILNSTSILSHFIWLLPLHICLGWMVRIFECNTIIWVLHHIVNTQKEISTTTMNVYVSNVFISLVIVESELKKKSRKIFMNESLKSFFFFCNIYQTIRLGIGLSSDCKCIFFRQWLYYYVLA